MMRNKTEDETKRKRELGKENGRNVEKMEDDEKENGRCDKKKTGIRQSKWERQREKMDDEKENGERDKENWNWTKKMGDIYRENG